MYVYLTRHVARKWTYHAIKETKPRISRFEHWSTLVKMSLLHDYPNTLCVQLFFKRDQGFFSFSWSKFFFVFNIHCYVLGELLKHIFFLSVHCQVKHFFCQKLEPSPGPILNTTCNLVST